MGDIIRVLILEALAHDRTMARYKAPKHADNHIIMGYNRTLAARLLVLQPYFCSWWMKWK